MLSDITIAAADADLQERAIAAAAQIGMPDPTGFARQSMPLIVAQETGANPEDPKATVADAYGYKVRTMPERPLRPGEDPGAVSDAMLITAVRKAATVLGFGGVR